MTGPDAGKGGRAPAPDAESRTPETRKRWWVPLVKLVLTVAVTWLILRGAGIRLGEAWTVDWTLVAPSAPLLALSVFLLLVTFGITSVLWSRILEELGERGIGAVEGAAILLIANLGRYVPGKIVQLAGVAVLARRRGLSGVRATAAAITAQMINLLGAAAVGGWVALWSTDLSGGRSLLVGLAIVAGLAAFLYFGGVGVLVRWVLRRGKPTGELPRPDGRRLLFLLPGYIVNWAVFGAAFVCLGRGLGLELGFWAGTTAFAAAYFVGYVFLFAPAGIGIRESAMVVLLTPVLGADPSLVLAALQRVWITAVELIGAAAGAFVLRGPITQTEAECPVPADSSLNTGDSGAGGTP